MYRTAEDLLSMLVRRIFTHIHDTGAFGSGYGRIQLRPRPQGRRSAGHDGCPQAAGPGPVPRGGEAVTAVSNDLGFRPESTQDGRAIHRGHAPVIAGALSSGPQAWPRRVWD